MAQVGAAFGMQVLGMNRSGNPVPHVEAVFTPDRNHELLGLCDVVLVILPLTPQTKDFFGAAEFAAMEPGALFLNLGRGRLVDTSALVEALRSGRLAGAGLDVVDPEPLPPDHPLWDMPQVILTPHYGGLHREYNRNAGNLFLTNLRRYLADEPLLHQIDKSLGY
jgi:phosphoglycerate dehydrogenase-like enzyme